MMIGTKILTEADYLRLDHILELGGFDDLEFEVSRARVMEKDEIPHNLITMHMQFEYYNLTDDKSGEMTIVYPDEANLDERKISVLAPLGAALIGLRENDEIDWTFPDGIEKRLKVGKIISRSEEKKRVYH